VPPALHEGVSRTDLREMAHLEVEDDQVEGLEAETLADRVGL
jgi:hypothetical protein